MMETTDNGLMKWMAEAWADRHPFWPLAEHNQGTLTIIALVTALLIAVYEVRRAARSEQRALIEYIDFVSNLSNYAMENTLNAIKTMDGTATDVEKTTLVVWDFAEGGFLGGLREVLAVKPAYPDLARAVGVLERVLAIDLNHTIMDREDKRQGLVAVLENLQTAKVRIERCRPLSDFERAKRFAAGLVARS
jgi:hypothetical protein